MRYFNENDVRNFNKSILLEKYAFSQKSFTDSFDVFLSHSSKDKDVLPSAINFLSEYGINVYIDKQDEKLPERTSTETALVLKERIKEARKFIVLVSRNSKDSRWIPWELGIADEKKKIKNIAILPIVQSNGTLEWPEQECLEIYPSVVNAKFAGQQKNVWMVYDRHTNKGTELGRWLREE